MNTAVISIVDGMADVWAKQFVDAFIKRPKKVEQGGTLEIVPPRFSIIMQSSPQPDEVISTIQKAVTQAGPGGVLVFNVGHGVSANATDGVVDLAANHKFRLGGLNNADDPKVFVSVFYDLDPDGPGPRMSFQAEDEKFSANPSRLKRWEKYKKIAKIVTDGRLRKVVFLTCKVGQSTDFLKKIALDWNVVVEAYKRRVQLTPQQNGRVRIHLEGDAPGQGTNIPASEENLFSNVFRSSDTVLVGPP